MSTAPGRRPHVEIPSALHLRVEGLCVDRGGRRIIDGLSFTVAGGEMLKVTGRNGVGKSTLLRALAALLPHTGGEIALDGAPEGDLLPSLHYLAHADGLKASLTVLENLEFWAAYLAHGAAAAQSLTPREALALVNLAHVAAAPVGVLSAGQKRRVALARLLVAFRPLWLLDEPLTALDAASRRRFADVMRDHCARGGLIVAATHEPLGDFEARELPMGAPA